MQETLAKSGKKESEEVDELSSLPREPNCPKPAVQSTAPPETKAAQPPNAKAGITHV